MEKIKVDPLRLFADGLTLVYHEARNVRHLVRDGHLPPTGWEKIRGLSANPVEAWKQLQPLRERARSRPGARHAASEFEKQFHRGLEDLQQLYDNPNWKHARAYGGHAWKGVTAVVFNLGRAIDGWDNHSKDEACNQLLDAQHNNGPLRRKILRLDQAIGVATDRWWQDDPSTS